MILPDVNVLVYAHREDVPDHGAYRDWLEGAINSAQAYAVSDIVMSGFVRAVTHPRVFREPSSIEDALEFAGQVMAPVQSVLLRAGPGHWDMFQRLCRESGVKGNLVPDAFLAALAIESGCEWITTDRDFSRCQGLKWRHPLA